MILYCIYLIIAVRQYGLQVVGKLQGTRRLPPPAWIPSIKAETGGLDTRIAIVPAGGSGWGSPAVSSVSADSVIPSADLEVTPTSWAVSTINGTIDDSVNVPKVTKTSVDTNSTDFMDKCKCTIMYILN